MKISEAAFNLIVTAEVSSQPYYTKHYQHFEFPGAASGPTVGIGYDCGYTTPAEIRKDWAGIIPPDAVEALTKASGLKGDAARRFVNLHSHSVTIPWDQAIQEFKTNEVPKWEQRVEKALPNTTPLSPDCFGALVSLAYNRGTGGFHDPGSRFAELRAITAHMQTKQFDKIPNEFLSMRRLWPSMAGLRKRREKEAALFTKGLQTDTLRL